MAEGLTDLDRFLLDQWSDATALRLALTELEGRLSEQLDVIAERLGPWLEPKGFVVLDVEHRHACINIGKKKWMKNQEDARIYISVAALFPFGFRKVQEEHPYVWVYAYGLSKQEQGDFRDAISKRLEGKPGGWINDGCDRRSPVGRYAKSFGDSERAKLALSLESLEEFVKQQLEPMLELGNELDAALEEV